MADIVADLGDIGEGEIITLPTQTSQDSNVEFAPFGTPIIAAEIQERLSASLYKQLSEASDDTTLRAVARAQVQSGAIFRCLNVPFLLDNTVVREIVLILTVYELHIALGHEEAGREYRIQAKNLIIAAYGKFPDTETETASVPAVAVHTPKRKPHQYNDYRRALERM